MCTFDCTTHTQVFWICISLLEMAYLVAILVGATSPFMWSKTITVRLTSLNLEIMKKSRNDQNTDSDLLCICLDCWTHPAGLTSLETGEICRFAKQNSNNILLHVHMEGKVLSIFFICFWAGFTL